MKPHTGTSQVFYMNGAETHSGISQDRNAAPYTEEQTRRKGRMRTGLLSCGNEVVVLETDTRASPWPLFEV